jgi:hypothetical protein
VARNAAAFSISYEKLAELLGLPEDAEISLVVSGDVDDLMLRQFKIVVRHDSMPPVGEGAHPWHFGIDHIFTMMSKTPKLPGGLDGRLYAR